MESDHDLQHVWTDRFHRWGIAEWSAVLLESAGPLTILGAQAIYLAQPLLNWFIPDKHLVFASDLLEEPDKLSQFINLLKVKTRSE